MKKCPSCGQELPRDSKFCEYCGSIIVKKRGKAKTSILLVLCIIFAFTTISAASLCVFLWNDNNQLKIDLEKSTEEADSLSGVVLQQQKEIRANDGTIEALRDTVKDLKNDLEDYAFDYEEKACFLDDSIGFITSSGKKYHTYDCYHFQNAHEYWAHNIEYCEYMGYSPCYECH